MPNLPKANIVINGIPKSATLYTVRVLMNALHCESHRISTRGFVHSLADVDLVDVFCKYEHSVAQSHIAPTLYSLRVLHHSGVNRTVVLLRDPRDVLASFYYHLERNDASGMPWHRVLMIAEGVIPPDYYDCSPGEKKEHLVRCCYPKIVDWMIKWKRLTNNGLVDILFLRYNDFVKDKNLYFDKIFKFYNLDISLSKRHFPKLRTRMDKTICLDTHFRKGVVGSYTTEFTPEQKYTFIQPPYKELLAHEGWL